MAEKASFSSRDDDILVDGLGDKCFKTLGVEPNGEPQSQFCHAADYADVWFNKGDRVFEQPICARAGHRTTSSDAWDGLHEDPIATG